MFGQPSTPFGAAPSTPFGQPAPAPSGGFGGFGAAPAPAFGAAPAPSTGFGGFGAAPAPTSTFGAPSAFGTAPAPTSTFGGGFGAATPAPAPFGSSGFGAAPAPATGGLFGGARAPAPSGGLFGAAPTPAPGTTSLFGAPAPAASPFGAAAPAPFGSAAPAPSGGLFGAPSPAPATGFGGFGAAPTSTFGQPAPAPFGAAPSTGFGAAPTSSPFGGGAGTQQKGTLAAPFQATNKSDGNNQISLQSITAMPQYESKSFEELRLEDYLAGNKGSQGQAPAPAGFGGFGAAPTPAPAFGQPAPAPSGGLFGSNPAPAPSTGLFGAPAPAPSGGLFGAPAPAPGQTSLFGQAPAPAQQGGFGFGSPAPAPAAFGAPKPGGLFGTAPSPAPATGLFGAAPAPPPAAGGLFGAQAPAPSLFGSTAPAPATGGLFGAPAPAPTTGGLFGAPAAPVPAPGASLFSAPAQAPAGGGLFSSTPAPASGGLFGSSPAPAAGGLFGAPAPASSGGLFGAPTPAPSAGGLFGATPAPAAGSLFGSPPPAAVAPAAPAVPPPSADAILAQQLASIENQKKELEMLNAWRGKPPSGSKVIPKSVYDSSAGRSWNGGGSSYASSSSALVSYQAAPRSSAKIRPRGYTPSKASPVAALGRKNGGSPILSPNRFVGSATKALFIKPNSMTPKPKMRLLLTNGVSESKADSSVANLENGYYGSPSPNKQNVPTQGIRNEEHSLQSPTPSKGKMPKPVDSASPLISRAAGSPSMNGHKNSPGYDLYKQVVGSPDSNGVNPSITSPTPTVKCHTPKLTKPGYVVYPSIEELEVMSEADLAAVYDFKVERPGFGSVAWDGAVDVRDVDLDSIVVIEKKNVSVYDDAELNGDKPKQGTKLNRPAVITMYDIFPKDGPASSADAKEKLKRKIEKSTTKMGAELLAFEADSGIWQFRVGHFSRYGLDEDSDDESDDGDDETPTPESVDEQPDEVFDVVQSEDGVKELGGVSRIRAPFDEDEDTSAYSGDMSEMMEQSEVEEDTEVNEIVRAGEEAYAQMTEEMMRGDDEAAMVPYDFMPEEAEEDDEPILFPDEAGMTTTPEARKTFPPVTKVSFSPPTEGICGKLASDCGLQKMSSSNIDHGIRMRRSFRVGWRPDGTFIHLKQSASGGIALVQSKPNIDTESSTKSHKALPLLETHKKYGVKVEDTDSDIPLFTLKGNSNASLCKALKEFSDSTAKSSFHTSTQHGVSSTFSLLSTLYGDNEAIHGSVDELRRLESLSTVMKQIVSNDVNRAISLAQNSGDVHGCIFGALSGGDNLKASSIAQKSGSLRLSLMLANSSPQARPLAEAQLEMWHQSGAEAFVPTGILRIFSLASGKMDVEEQIFKSNSASYDIDWRRNFGMRLWSSYRSEGNSISSTVNHYSACVSAGLAPPAKPFYSENMPFDASKPMNHCVIYQVLNHYANQDTSLSNIIAPASHTSSYHDYSLSFHLSSAISSLSNATLGRYVENVVVESVSSQLLLEGFWEWAVYATLCVISGTSVSGPSAHARRLKAKDIIMRNFSPSTDPSAGRRRAFLESLGIPSEFFHEAHAYRCANEGNVFGYVENLMRFSTKTTLEALENLIIPSMILSAPNKLMDFLDAISLSITEDSQDLWNKPYGCGSIHKFLVLRKKVEVLSELPASELATHRDEISQLLETVSELDSMMKEPKIPAKEFLITAPIQLKKAPRHVTFAEVAAALSLIRMQLIALQNGRIVPMNDDTTTMYDCSSQLAFTLTCDGLFGTSSYPIGNASILRGQCGYFVG